MLRRSGLKYSSKNTGHESRQGLLERDNTRPPDKSCMPTPEEQNDTIHDAEYLELDVRDILLERMGNNIAETSG